MKAVLVLLGVFTLTASTGLAKHDADAEFEQIMQRHWQNYLAQNPVFATSVGVRDYDHKLPDPSLVAYQQSVDTANRFLQQLDKVKVTALSRENQLNHQLLTLDLQNEVTAANFGGKYLILTNRSGPHLQLASMVDRLPFFKPADYQSYLQRLAAMPGYLHKATQRLRAGIVNNWVQACEPMRGYEKSIALHRDARLEDSVFMQPFQQDNTVLSDKEYTRMRQAAAALVENKLKPALAQFYTFYTKEYAPACRAIPGIHAAPKGLDYYQSRIAYYTTTGLSADDIHQIGLKEVARIKAEMLDVIKQAGFEGDFAQWLDYLRDNRDFYPKTAEERIQIASTISKKMDGELPKLFSRLPRMPYGIKAIPADIAEKTTTAYYRRPAGDGSRAGTYFLNTSLLHTRPNYQLEALSLHEAVPGHHFQIALAQELQMPPFRRFGGQTVFVEGWGLYAERLGLEAGFYQTPYTNFGRLSYEMWRACRLVVDTGIHSKGWSRQQAIDYMAEHSGLSMNNITSEVDRYITWPGQALAYKTGELKIRELRAKAKAALGEQFDIRLFHDTILGQGSVPLSVLETIIDEWIAASKAADGAG